MPPRPGPVDESEFTEVFLHGSGPGGQKIVCHPYTILLLAFETNFLQNKTSSAVQLKHLATGTVLKVQATRSRTQNRKLARQMLADKLDDMQNGDKSRNAIVGEVKKRKKSSSEKKKRRKYKLLDEEKRANNVAEGAREQD